MKFFELEPVAVTRDFLEYGVKRGEVGTIVAVFSYPREAYEVEFVFDNGMTKVMLVALPNEIEKIYQS